MIFEVLGFGFWRFCGCRWIQRTLLSCYNLLSFNPLCHFAIFCVFSAALPRKRQHRKQRNADKRRHKIKQNAKMRKCESAENGKLENSQTRPRHPSLIRYFRYTQSRKYYPIPTLSTYTPYCQYLVLNRSRRTLIHLTHHSQYFNRY